ncbi:glycoside hydrolase family 38 C-terminal domain-containing protein [Dyadobacter endophyticus]|uniref:glycoside hydrolase family 38 N-terminal domain-containing protein n=1 Tax=Dyadobacter TaxID=120831 RepID=UPI003CEFDC42
MDQIKLKKESTPGLYILFVLLLSTSLLQAQNMQIIKAIPASDTASKPQKPVCKVQPFYRYGKDRKPVREIMLHLADPGFFGKGTLEITCLGEKEITHVTIKEGTDSLAALLPVGAGVKTDCEVQFRLLCASRELKGTVKVPALRQWTVYIYPHSHVDIGYTNTQANVEFIHKRNLVNGIALAKKTAEYPEGARYLWNPEVLWPVDRYLKTATPAQKQEIIDAVRKGYLRLDASYVNTNTSAAADEEMFEFLEHGKDLEKLTGTKIETFVQVDVPGMSWGIVPVAAKLGVKYVFAMNNGSDRVGLSTDLSFKPFWWMGIDGKSKVLFLQPGSYTPGERAKGHDYWPKMLGQTDTTKLIPIVKTDYPRQHFVDKYLAEKLPELEKSGSYPYDIFAMSWAMADNTPIDADLPDAVKSWNEDYAFPHLVIAGATDIMQAFEKKYADQLPVLSGDFTEYWTDGLGAAAKQTSMNRNTKERLIQNETLWTMLHPGEPAPRAEIKEAWRNVSMGTEHTWCYFDPSKQPITNDILQVKFGFFQEAEKTSKSLLNLTLANVSQDESSAVGVFNTLSWKRSGLVYLTAQQSGRFNGIADEKGRKVSSQRLSSGELIFLAADVPAFGLKKYQLKNKKTKTSKKLAENNVLDNGIVRVVIDPQTGEISSLISGSKEFADANSKINSFRYLFGDDKTGKGIAGSNAKISIKENGPLLASILVESDAEGCNSLTREITIIAGQPYIEIKNIVDKKPVLKKEGIHFGFAFDIKNPVIRADIPWGVIDVDSNQLSAANRNWIGFQRWLDIGNNTKGVTWCSLDAPVFEVGSMTANVLGSATNSKEWIKKIEPSSSVYSWALNNHWHTNFPLSQQGKMEFRYRILPRNAAYDAGRANRFGVEQAQPLMATAIDKTMRIESPVSLEGSDQVLISILKTDLTGNNTELRIRSVSEKDQVVKLNWMARKPESIAILDQSGKINNRGEVTEIVVPAMGFLTIEAKFPNESNNKK